MAKRFTDNEKWKKQWFRKLPNDMKVFWIYICDSCNIAGVWEVDFDLASFMTGNQIEESVALRYMDKQIRVLSLNKWLIVDFVSFQYGSLIPNNNMHKAVIRLLETSGASEGLVRGLDAPMVKDKVKDKDIKGVIGGFIPPTIEEVKAYAKEANLTLDCAKLVDFYQSKGWMVGKSKMKDWKASVRNWARSVKEHTKFADGKPITKPIEETPRRKPDPKQQEEVSNLIKQTVTSMDFLKKEIK